MLELENIEKDYRQGKEIFRALRNINLTVPTGECLAVVGKSGCGKTTLLNIIAGLIGPSSGTVRLEQREIHKPDPDIAMVFQQYGLFPWKTVRKNLLLPLQLKHGRSHYGEVDEMLERLELSEHEDKYMCQLSGGQRQRVAIGRMLLCGKKVLLMDEPFSALDSVSRELLKNSIKQLFQENQITSVIVTHSISEAIFMGDKIAVFSKKGKEIQRVVDNPAAGLEDKNSLCYLTIKQQIEKLMAGENDVA